jgi:putative ABC transport system ATP-binding protein
MSKPLISTKDVKVIYNLGKQNEVRALDGVSIDIYPQEYIVFLGPSGCGKSTLLYTILGLQKPTSGEVFIDGRAMSTFTEKERDDHRRLTSGIVFQSFHLISTLTVLGNVTLPQVFRGGNITKRREKGMELLTRFGIESQANKPPTSLSGGQMQRVAISRALINDPPILYGDEPVGNLDTESAKTVMDHFDKINQVDKKTVLLVTHDPRYIQHAHRVYYISDGKVVRELKNPKKGQVKPTAAGAPIFTELDELAQMHPYDRPIDLKPKALAYYLTQTLTRDQQSKLENNIKELLNNRIDINTYQRNLDKPIESGGVGLYAQTAESIARRTVKLMDEVNEFRKGLLKVSEPTEEAKLVARLREFILEEYQGQISMAQLQRLDASISKRIVGILTKIKFQQELDKPFDKGGVGLNRNTSRTFMRKLEALLAQAK